MADFLNAMRQAQELQARMQQIQDELGRATVTGVAGGGMVKAEADGKGQIKRISIDPSVVSKDDIEMLEDLLLVAVQDAQKRATDLAQAEMSKLTGGLNLPFKLPF